jgi:polyhydroxyalkanoate synthesis regulator phasin
MTIKNMIYVGLGIGNMVSEKTYEHYKALIENGKKADPKISSTLEGFFENFDSHKKEVKDKVLEGFKTLADKLGYIKLDDYEYLQKRIKNLEADLAKAKNENA